MAQDQAMNSSHQLPAIAKSCLSRLASVECSQNLCQRVQLQGLPFSQLRGGPQPSKNGNMQGCSVTDGHMPTASGEQLCRVRSSLPTHPRSLQHEDDGSQQLSARDPDAWHRLGALLGLCSG